MRISRARRFAAPLALALAAALGIAGCTDAIDARPGTTPASNSATGPVTNPATGAGDPAPAQASRPATGTIRLPPVVFARVGEPLVVPVEPHPEAVASGRVGVVIAGRRVEGRLHRVRASDPPREGTLAKRVTSWTLSPGAFSSLPAEAGAQQAGRGEGGLWVLWMPGLPATAASAEVMQVEAAGGGGRARVDWREPPREMVEAILDRGPELSPLLTAMTDRLMGDPWERWRAKVASSRALGVDEDRLIDDPVVAGLARQRERAWLTALAAVWRADRDVALELVDELARVIDITDEGAGGGVGGVGGGGGGSERVPLWTTDAALLDDLLWRLTDASATRASVLSAARAFLALRGAGGALVIDDAGVLGADGQPLPALWAVNFGSSPAAVSIRERASDAASDAAPDGQEPQSLPPRAARRVYATDEGVSQRAGASEVAVRVGEWEATRRVIGERIRVTPPGLSIGPMLADWSMAEAGEQARVRPGRAGVGVALPRADAAYDAQGRLYREPGRGGKGGEGGAGGAGGAWTVYMECRRPADAPRGTDRLTLWFGPTGGPQAGSAATLSVTETGEISLRVGGQATQNAGVARVTRLADRWIVWLPVPPAVIERAADDGVVQIGVVREDARGVRTSWPRPMLPWMTEPGRVAADISAWGVD